jgi:hypothetical protein
MSLFRTLDWSNEITVFVTTRIISKFTLTITASRSSVETISLMTASTRCTGYRVGFLQHDATIHNIIIQTYQN